MIGPGRRPAPPLVRPVDQRPRPVAPGDDQGGGDPQRPLQGGVGGGGENGGGARGVEPVEGVRERGPQQFARAQAHDGLHGLARLVLGVGGVGGVQGAPSQDVTGLLPQGGGVAGLELGVVVEPGDGLGALGEAVGGPAGAGQDVAQAAGGDRGVAQHGQVPVGAADLLGESAEGQQSGVGVGPLSEPADDDGQELALDGGAAADALGERLDVVHGPGGVAVSDGGQALAGGAGGEGHLVGGEAGGGPQQGPVVDLLVQGADLAAGGAEGLAQGVGVVQGGPVDSAADAAQVGVGVGQVVGAA